MKDNYIVQRPVSLLERLKKRLWLDINEDNRKKLRDQPVAAIREKETVQFLNSWCLCTPTVKVKIEWQMIFLAIKINMDIIDGIPLLVVLYSVKNFKPCNKYLRLFARYVSLVTKKFW